MLLAQYANHHAPQGRKAVVRNGYLPEREVQTGIGAVRVKVPRVRVVSQFAREPLNFLGGKIQTETLPSFGFLTPKPKRKSPATREEGKPIEGVSVDKKGAKALRLFISS